jgi:hypothetical protein
VTIREVSKKMAQVPKTVCYSSRKTHETGVFAKTIWTRLARRSTLVVLCLKLWSVHGGGTVRMTKCVILKGSWCRLEGGWIGESAHLKIFNPLLVLKPVRPVSKTGQTGFTQTEPTIRKTPLRVLAQTKLGVDFHRGFKSTNKLPAHSTSTPR